MLGRQRRVGAPSVVVSDASGPYDRSGAAVAPDGRGRPLARFTTGKP